MPAVDYKYLNITPYLTILVGRTELSTEVLRLVKSVKVGHARGKAATCELVFSDPEYLIQDSGLIKIGSMITIIGGWSQEIRAKGPFRIHDYDPYCPENGEPTLTIRGKDNSVGKMHNKARSKSHNDRKLSDIVADVAKAHSLLCFANIPFDDDVIFNDENSLTQANETDAQFLQRLAGKTGYVWRVEGDKLYFHKPETISTKPIILSYRTGRKNIKSFRPEIKVFAKPTGQKAGGAKVVAAIDFLGTDNAEFFEQVVNASDELGVPITDLEVIDGLGSRFFDGKNSDGGVPLTYLAQAHDSMNGVVGDRRDVPSTSQIANPTITPAHLTITGMDGLEKGAKPVGVLDGIKNGIDNIKKRFDRQKGKDAADIMRQDGKGGFIVNDVTGTLSPLFDDSQLKEITYEVLKGDEFQGAPKNKEEAKKMLARKVKSDAIAVGCEIEPTVPSWDWNASETVFVEGVPKLCIGLYEVHEVDLEYDGERGLSTKLTCKKRTIGSSKSKGKNLKPDEGPTGSSNDPNNPRKPDRLQNAVKQVGYLVNDITGTLSPTLIDASEE